MIESRKSRTSTMNRSRDAVSGDTKKNKGIILIVYYKINSVI